MDKQKVNTTSSMKENRKGGYLKMRDNHLMK